MITKLFGRFLPFVCSIVLAGGLAACGGGGSTPATPTPTGPTITTQPASMSVVAGQPAAFSVVATSTQSIAYQWRRNGTNISGANAATYQLASVAVGDNGAVFSVVATDPFGSVTSSNATLTVTTAAPVITAQPAATSVPDGQTASFAVTATSALAVSYQWRKNGTNIAGANGATYLTPALALADSGALYSVVVTNSAGSVTSSDAAVTVTNAPPTISSQPANVSVPDLSTTASFQVTATGSATLTYQWQTAPSGSSTFTNIGGATTNSYAITSATLALSGVQYRVVVTNPAGSVTSSAATLTVTGNAPAITVQPASQTVNDGAAVTFSVTATGSSPLGYQWRLNGTDIPSATSDTYVLATAGLSNDGEDYSVVVSNGFGSPATSANAHLTVTALPVAITAQPVAAQTVTELATASFSVTAATGSDPKTYQWRRNGVDIGGATSATYSIPSVRFTDDGASFTVVVDNAYGPPVTSSASVLTVTQTVFAPVIQTQPADQNKLEGAAATFTVALSAGTSPSYQWQKQPSGGGGFTNIPGEVSATLSFTAAFADTGAQYQVVVNSTPVSSPVTSTPATLTVTQQAVSLLAGQNGGAGNVDGPAASALFSFPGGVTVSPAGITYLADFANDTVRKIAADGTTTTLAGKAGVQGSADGSGVNATFNSLYDVAVAPDDSVVYVADYANGLIRKVLANGTVTTLSGSFALPRGLALSGATTVDTGTLYVVEIGGNVIKAIDLTNGNITTIAGSGVAGGADGSGVAATFNAPTDLVVDPGATAAANDDILYVADSGNSAIRKIDRASADAVTTLVGHFGDSDGNSATAAFNYASGVALVGTDLYVADTNNHVIRKVNLASGSPTTDANYVVTVAGTSGVAGNTGGVGAAAQFFLPYGIAADPGGGRLVVSNFGNNIIDEIAITAGPTYTSSALSGSASRRGFANGTGTAAQFNYPRGLATAANGDNYVADSVNQLIRKVTSAGVVTTYAGTFAQPGAADGAAGSATFNDPSGVAVDGGGVVYVADGGNSKVRWIDSGGTTVSTIASGLLNNPRAVASNAAGTILYVANSGGNNILKITNPTTAPAVTVLAGVGGGGSLIGNSLTAQFQGPAGLALDEAHGKLYVADTGNYEVRVIDLNSGTPTTDVNFVKILAGDHTNPGTQDGSGASARFTTLVSVAYDAASSNLYVTDYGAHTLKQIVISSGAVTTLVGNPAIVGVTLGSLNPPSQTRSLNGPTAVQVAPAGATPGTKLVLLDGTEHVVLRITVLP